MIEVAFTESAQGGLTLAQSFGKGVYNGGCIGVIIHHEDGSEPTQEEIDEAQHKAEEQHRKAWESAAPLGGKTGDVYGFSMGLSFGDISDSEPEEARITALKVLYSFWDADIEDHTRACIKKIALDIAKLKERVSSGEDMRIWYSDNPDELCGFYWLMDQLRHLPENHGTIFAVKLPEFEEKGDTIISYTGWGEVEPGHFGNFIHLARPVSDQLRRYYGNAWKQLQRENSLIRACINGRLVSAPDDLYDRYISAEIDAQPDEFMEAIVVGNVLGKYQPGIGDGYIHYRIEKMVESGKFKAITAPPDGYAIYHRMLKKV